MCMPPTVSTSHAVWILTRCYCQDANGVAFRTTRPQELLRRRPNRTGQSGIACRMGIQPRSRDTKPTATRVVPRTAAVRCRAADSTGGPGSPSSADEMAIQAMREASRPTPVNNYAIMMIRTAIGSKLR
jgi:hypothetical protein